MTFQPELSLSDLVEIVGIKRRTIQLWAEAGVIQAVASTERAGTGTHRQFSWYEAKLACLLSPLCDLQLPIGKMLEVSKSMRRDGYSPWPPEHHLINAIGVYRAAKAPLKRLSERTGIFSYDPTREAYLVLTEPAPTETAAP